MRTHLGTTTNPKVGDRVIVRRRLPDTPGHLTDVIGHVLSTTPLIVRPQSVGGFVSTADAVEIPAELIQVVKVLPPRRVRNSDIRAVETATAMAFPGIEHVWQDGWLLRAGDGITERSNSAAPLGSSAGLTPVPMAAIQEFYDRHNLPVQLLIPDRIGNSALQFARTHGWSFGPDIVVMTRELSDPDPLPTKIRFDIQDQPDEDWLKLYHFRGQPLPAHALELLRTQIEGHMCFGRILSETGETIAITRGTLTETPDGRRFLGYSAVEVAPAYRRQGLGTALGQRMVNWGIEHGATDAYLQVLASNDAGIGLYEKLGFVEHHRHRYASPAS
ncbi:N-acetylglutamate synthase, CG3035 family [Corynebacterium hindlerae]|uniref:N-acetylglutamate synthase, CG3035 family n=1 Tax=Corynebacterium hindlerae TaxID=699041 RepID=UPI0031B6FD69